MLACFMCQQRRLAAEVERRKPIKATDPSNRKSATLEQLSKADENRAAKLKELLTKSGAANLESNLAKRQSVMLLQGTKRSDQLARLFGGSSKFNKEEEERKRIEDERKRKEAEQKRLMAEEEAKWQAERLAKEAKGYGSDEEWSDSDADGEPEDEPDDDDEPEEDDDDSDGMQRIERDTRYDR